MSHIVTDKNQDRFLQRLDTINQNTPGEDGRVERRISKDGLVMNVAVNRKAAQAKRMAFSLKPVFMLLGFVIITKALLFANLGEVEYTGRVASLDQGQPLDAPVVFILNADPATRAVADAVTKMQSVFFQ